LCDRFTLCYAESVVSEDSAWIMKLSPSLFWDVYQRTVDPDRHARWLLERILERGRWEDWESVRDNLGRKQLDGLYETIRVSPKSLNFLRVYLCRSSYTSTLLIPFC